MRNCLHRLLFLVLLPLLAIPQAARAGDEPVLLLQSSSGTYDLDGERRLIIEEITGTLSLRAATNDTIRFEGRSLGSERDLQEVALWREGDNTLLLGPAAEVPAEGTLVDMLLPEGLDVEVFLVGGRLLVSAIGGDLRVEAENSKIQARGLLDDAEFRLTGGVLTVDGVKGDFSVKGSGVQVDLQHLYGSAELDLTEGRAKLDAAELDVQVTSDQTDLEFSRVKGELRVDSSGGSLHVSGCTGGGELQLEETTLALLSSKGDFTVRTDAMMEFGLHEGSLRVLGYGASIQGNQIAGPLFVENSSSSVTLKQLSGKTEIRGTELKLTVEDSKGPLDIHLVSSDVTLRRVDATVLVENQFGDIQTSETKTGLTITSSGGNVQVANHQGPLEIRADGPEVRVGWSKFTKYDTMKVRNATGDIYLGLPATGRCNLQVKARFGRVDVGTTGIQVSDDGHSVGGEYTGGRAKAPQVKKPNLQVVSGGGNVYIGTASATD